MREQGLLARVVDEPVDRQMGQRIAILLGQQRVVGPEAAQWCGGRS